MAADADGGITLRIDADTAAFVAKIAKMADAQKGVKKHADDWGTALEHVTGQFTEMATKVGGILAIGEMATKVFEDWKKALEDAGRSTETIVRNVRGITAQTGENREQVASQILGANSQLSLQERTQAVQAFRAAAPGSEKVISSDAILRGASMADIVGFNSNQFSTLSGNLYNSFGTKSFDAAAMLTHAIGAENVDQVGEMMNRLGLRGGSKATQQALPYILSAAISGDRRMESVQAAVDAYNPDLGSFGSQFDITAMRAGPNKQNLYRSVRSNLGAAQKAIGGIDGSLQGRAAQMINDDESLRVEIGVRATNAQAEIENYRRRYKEQEEYDQYKAASKLTASKSLGGIGGEWDIMGIQLHPAGLVNDLTGVNSEGSQGDTARSIANGGNSGAGAAVQHLSEIKHAVTASAKSNQEIHLSLLKVIQIWNSMTNRPPRSGAQGEDAR